MSLSRLYKILLVICVFFMLGYTYYSYTTSIYVPKIAQIQQTTGENLVDGCMVCHKNYGSIDDSHPVEIFGCAKCHGGDPFEVRDENKSHQGMVLNPSYLHHAQIFCFECHSDIIQRVSTSPMQTQKGIVDVMHEQWVDKSTTNISKDRMRELTQNHIDKGCASCHINQDENIFLDKSMAKGGGCANCHRIQKDGNQHPKFSTKIPSKTCLKCHNRSNRIGISYFGKFESEGYGTPFIDGNLSNKLDSSRFYYELPADVHHTKLELDCIDCHTGIGVMGDGKVHAHMEDAFDISCNDCHNPRFDKINELGVKLIDLNSNIPYAHEVAYSKKNTAIYNLRREKDKLVLYRKKDGSRFEYEKMSDEPYHTSGIHEKLDCSACHSRWMPSCYGCHEVYLDKGKQFDWKKNAITSGEWIEFRSFLRFEEPSLGVGYNGKIMPFAPGCQVIGTVFENNTIDSFHAMAMAGWNPHTTGKSKTCVECHFSSAALGFGRGILDKKDNKLYFLPFYDSNSSGQPFAYPIDSFVNINGKQNQTTSRDLARAFNKDEIDKITDAYNCIICHNTYEDKIYIDYNRSKVKFSKGNTACQE